MRAAAVARDRNRKRSAPRRFCKRIRKLVRGQRRPPTSPEAVRQRWRSLSAGLLSKGHFEAAGLDTVWDRNPGKYDRQVIAIQCLRNVCNGPAEGAIIEFGCYDGHTAVQMVHTLRELGDESRVILLDSFEGMPESNHDLDRYWNAGALKADYEDVKARFKDFSHVEVVKGYFDQTLPRYGDLKIKFAHVDCDMYKSVRDVHVYLLPRMVDGGVIVYDDYGFESCEGLMKAVDEDFIGRDEFFQLSLPSGQYLAIKRPSRNG